MAQDEGAPQAGEDPAPQPNGGDNLTQIGLITQYIKDLSFENPNAPGVYQWQGQPQIDVQFNLKINTSGDEVHELVMTIDLSAKAEQRIYFQVELAYAGLFAVRNLPDDQLQPFLLTEAPRLLFPFARRVIADAVRDGGFPALMLDPIDFHALYAQRGAENELQAGGGIGEISGQA